MFSAKLCLFSLAVFDAHSDITLYYDVQQVVLCGKLRQEKPEFRWCLNYCVRTHQVNAPEKKIHENEKKNDKRELEHDKQSDICSTVLSFKCCDAEHETLRRFFFAQKYHNSYWAAKLDSI